VRYPNPKDENDCTASFRAHKKQFRLPLYPVCDFESFLSPLGKDDDDDDDGGGDDVKDGDDGKDANDNRYKRGTRFIEEHQVCGFACHRVTDIDEYQIDPVVYSGPDVMSKFYDHVMNESKIISKILQQEKNMSPMTEKERDDYEATTHCTSCGMPFTEINWKVRHHCHASGRYLYPACNNCNLQLKVTSRKRKATDSNKNKKKRRKRRMVVTGVQNMITIWEKNTIWKISFCLWCSII